MSGAAAENYFGLSTQIPMKIVYVTSGSARKLSVGNTVIEFKRGVPKNFAFKDTVTTGALTFMRIWIWWFIWKRLSRRRNRILTL